ncbi:MAG: hypothetical protein O2782_00990, partial [bacterium]|nr:hypothetical protein [bacterium]
DEEHEEPRATAPSAAASTVVEEPAPAAEPEQEARLQQTAALGPDPGAEPLDDTPRGNIDDGVENQTAAAPANADEEEQEDEPFGRVQLQPEWVVAPAVELVAEPETTEDSGPMADDEVAALGAGLFEDETPTRPARGAKKTVPAPPVAESDLETPAGVDQWLKESAQAAGPPASPQHLAEAVPPMAAASETELGELEIELGELEIDGPGPDAAVVAAVTPGVAQLAGRRGSELAELLREFDAGPARPAEGTEPGRDSPVATVTLAEIYVGQGYPEQALEIYQRVLRADPDNETAKRGAAELR